MISGRKGVRRGPDAVRENAAALRCYEPGGNYRYDDILVAGDVAVLEWHAHGKPDIHDGADTFVVRDGRIAVPTIHYSADGSPAGTGGDDSSS